MSNFFFNIYFVAHPDQALNDTFNQPTTVHIRELEKMALRSIDAEIVEIDECNFIGQLDGHYAFLTDRGLMVVVLTDDNGVMPNSQVEEIF